MYHLCRSKVHPPAHLALDTAHVSRSFTGEFGDRRQPRCFACTHRLVCRHPFQHQLPSIITLIHRCSERLRDPSVGSVLISRNPLASGGEIFHARATDHITVGFGSVLCPVFAVRGDGGIGGELVNPEQDDAHQRPLILAANYKTTVAATTAEVVAAATVWLVRPPPCCINDHRKRFRNGERVRWTVKCPITVFAREGRRDIVNDSGEEEMMVDGHCGHDVSSPQKHHE